MTRDDLTEKLLDIKREKGWTWKYICGEIGGMSPILVTGAILGQMKLTKPQAAAAAKLFGLSKSEQTMLNEVPMRGTGTPMPPTDPLIYRLYELVMVNGPALKALIEEEFGDGIMSAIDFDMDIRAAVDAPRLHHPWFPDTASFEGGGDHAEAVRRLEAMGHSIHGTRQGDAHSIWLDPKTGKYVGAEDRRINGKVSGF